jgi:hypothetical protein
LELRNKPLRFIILFPSDCSIPAFDCATRLDPIFPAAALPIPRGTTATPSSRPARPALPLSFAGAGPNAQNDRQFVNARNDDLIRKHLSFPPLARASVAGNGALVLGALRDDLPERVEIAVNKSLDRSPGA